MSSSSLRSLNIDFNWRDLKPQKALKVHVLQIPGASECAMQVTVTFINSSSVRCFFFFKKNQQDFGVWFFVLFYSFYFLAD